MTQNAHFGHSGLFAFLRKMHKLKYGSGDACFVLVVFAFVPLKKQRTDMFHKKACFLYKGGLGASASSSRREGMNAVQGGFTALRKACFC